jgi:hypothetical protein
MYGGLVGRADTARRIEGDWIDPPSGSGEYAQNGVSPSTMFHHAMVNQEIQGMRRTAAGSNFSRS